jgi:hypothetical protein
VVDVEDQGKVERVRAGGQGFGQDAVAPDVLEGDAALVPAEVVSEVAGGDRPGAQGAFARDQDVPAGGVRPGGAPVVEPGQQGNRLRLRRAVTEAPVTATGGRPRAFPRKRLVHAFTRRLTAQFNQSS